MEKLKVISEKYNDKDILQFDSKKFAELVQKHEFVNVPDDETDFSKYVGKAFNWQGLYYYPSFGEEAPAWFEFSDDGYVYVDRLGNDNQLITREFNLNNLVNDPVRRIFLDYSNSSLELTEQDVLDLQAGQAILSIKDDVGDLQTFYPVWNDYQGQSVILVGYVRPSSTPASGFYITLTEAHARNTGFDIIEENTLGSLIINQVQGNTGSVNSPKLSTLKIGTNVYPVGTTRLYKHTVDVESSDDSEHFVVISNDSSAITSANFNNKMTMTDDNVIKILCKGESGPETVVLNASIANDKISIVEYDGSSADIANLAQDYTVTDNLELL